MLHERQRRMRSSTVPFVLSFGRRTKQEELFVAELQDLTLEDIPPRIAPSILRIECVDAATRKTDVRQETTDDD